MHKKLKKVPKFKIGDMLYRSYVGLNGPVTFTGMITSISHDPRGRVLYEVEYFDRNTISPRLTEGDIYEMRVAYERFKEHVLRENK